MSFPAQAFRVTMAALLLAVVLVGCGGHDTGLPAVQYRVVSGPGTRQILVISPKAKGSWPVVVAYHGSGGSADQMREAGKRLAQRGFVVFAPNWRTDLSSQQGVVDAVRDAECGYRYVRTVAARYGGDLRRPVTWLGWSLGALFTVQAGLEERVDPTGKYVTCYSEVPRPDVIVAVDGCYYAFQGRPIAWLDTGTWDSPRARLTVVAGEKDEVCPAAQSLRLSKALRAHGYSARYIPLPGADHFSPMFLSETGGRWSPAPGSQAGLRTIEAVVAAVKAARSR